MGACGLEGSAACRRRARRHDAASPPRFGARRIKACEASRARFAPGGDPQRSDGEQQQDEPAGAQGTAARRGARSAPGNGRSLHRDHALGRGLSTRAVGDREADPEFACGVRRDGSRRAIRRAGSAALDLAYVASGVFDGFFEFRLAPWDVAAGALLIEEAGGQITDFDGGKGYLERGNVVAGAPGVAEGLRAVAKGIVSEQGI